MKQHSKREGPLGTNEASSLHKTNVRPTAAQVKWLKRGLDQPGGKLPLFDDNGREISARTIDVCIANHWAEPWFSNPIKPDWRVCRLTEAGRQVIAENKS
ncbi:MAG: hypothetical protein ABJN26_22015 [Stappiaceae bacterium]